MVGVVAWVPGNPGGTGSVQLVGDKVVSHAWLTVLYSNREAALQACSAGSISFYPM